MNTLWAMMNDPARATLWAALQAELLVLSAILIGLYLREIWKMRKAAENQVRESQDQLEAQIRPALAVQVRNPPESLLLVNVGKGPALNLILSPAERGSEGSRECSDRETFNVPITFIEAGGSGISGVRTQAHPGLGGAVLNGVSLQCQYTSLSGRIYWTVVDFDKPSGTTVIATRFNGGQAQAQEGKSPA
jgi:hypothetical protein